MRTQTIIKYSLAALVVIILGAFSGWYFFLQTRSQDTFAQDSARGYGTAAMPAGTGNFGSNSATAQPASFLSRMLSSITGQGTGVSPAPTSAPFGQESSSFGTGASANTPSAPVPEAKRPPQLWHVHSKPVAGAAFVRGVGGERLRYVERATGFVFEADTGTSVVTRITNTLAPKTYEAIVTPNKRVFQRSLDEAGRLLTAVWTITASSSTAATTSATLSSIALPKDIAHIAADPRSDALFYLVNSAAGVVGFRSEWNGTKPKQVFTSAITNWHPIWLSDGRIILAQAAADNIPGYAYELATNGVLRPLLRAIPGLTVVPRTSGALLYGESRGGRLALFAQVDPSATAIAIPIKTIADKCVWAPLNAPQSGASGAHSATQNVVAGKGLVAYCAVPQGLAAQNFLDDWYRGVVHSSDALWRVDASAGAAELVFAPESGTSIDMENLTMNSEGSYVAFMDNNDQSLWVLRIEK